MAVTVYGRTQDRTFFTPTNEDFSFDLSDNGNVADNGDTMIVVLSRRNGSTTGAQTHPTSSGWTEVAHLDPDTSYKTFGTVFKKLADGTETSSTVFNFDWVSADGQDHQVWAGWVWKGGDYASVTASMLNQASASTHTFPADALDNSRHFWSVKDNPDIDEDYPSGDTNVVHTQINYHNGGSADSGGGTTSGSFSATTGMTATISISEESANATTDVTTVSEGADLSPTYDLSAGFDVDVSTITGTCTSVNFRVSRASDGFYWQFNTLDWQAGSHTYADTVSETTDFTHTFTGRGPTELNETDTFTLSTQAVDGAGTSPWVDRTFTSKTWEYTTVHTVTAFIPNPTAVADNAVTNMDTLVNIDVLANDLDVDPAATLAIVSQASNGTAVVVP